MILSVASGKGGTGKTLVATSLALSLDITPVQFLDCDVEEPNAHLFIKPEIIKTEPIYTLVPTVDGKLCSQSGDCARFCQYNALLVLTQEVMDFLALCHSCGGCQLVCPQKAMTEERHQIGSLKIGNARNIDFFQGELEVGKPLSVPVIKEVKKHIKRDVPVIIDSPPGTSCPIVEAVRGSDFCLLVTEPTPFGLYDLKMAVEVLEKIGLRFGIVINRADIGDRKVREFSEEKNIPILMEIPFSREIAEFYSRGFSLVEARPEWKKSS